MHRRQFINAAAGALLLPAGLARAGQGSAPDGTPAATPQHHGRPRPIVLGDGIELIDYRIYPSPDVPRIIGEISSTRDGMVDSPVVSITFPDLGEAGLAWAPPLLPVMRPGESNMIFGILPDGIDSEEALQTATFGLCSPVQSGPLTELHSPLRLRLEIVLEERLDWGQHIEAVVHNDADTIVQWVKIKGLVRDESLRYAGVVPEIDLWSMPVGHSIPFGVWISPADLTAANPFRMLDVSSVYYTELFAGTIGNVVNQGCSAFRD